MTIPFVLMRRSLISGGWCGVLLVTGLVWTAVAARAETLTPGKTLCVHFHTNPPFDYTPWPPFGTLTPDRLEVALSPVLPTGSPQVTTTLVDSYNAQVLGSFTGPVPLLVDDLPNGSHEAKFTSATYPGPNPSTRPAPGTTVDFDSMLDGSILGVFKVRIDAGSLVVDLAEYPAGDVHKTLWAPVPPSDPDGGEVADLAWVTIDEVRMCTPVDRDFDGDTKREISVFRPSSGAWFFRRGNGSVGAVAWGQSGDTPVPGDYDGDEITDVAVFRPSTGGWFIIRSSGGSVGLTWGGPGDVPVPGDYDGDGITDIAIFRPSQSAWYIIQSSGGAVGLAWGGVGDTPVPADYDGDGKTDVAVFRPSQSAWYIVQSSGGSVGLAWGTTGDQPVVGDYDGDGKADVAVFRESDGGWYIVKSSGGATGFTWGTVDDQPVVGDYDGDGVDDVAVFRESDGGWYIMLSGGGGLGIAWGTAGDVPL